MSDLGELVQKSWNYIRDFPKNHKFLTGAAVTAGTLTLLRVIAPELIIAPDYLRHMFVSTTIAYGTTVSTYELTNSFLEDKLNNMNKKQRLLTKTGILAGSLVLGFGIAFVLGEGFEYYQKLGMISPVNPEKVYSPINYKSIEILKPANNYFSKFKDSEGDMLANICGNVGGLGLGTIYTIRHKIGKVAKSTYSLIQKHLTT